MVTSSSRIYEPAVHAPLSLDEFITALEGCEGLSELFGLLEAETRREGYHNVVFARIFGSPERFEVPFATVPEGDARAYFENRLWEHDPILAATQQTSLPFTWIDIMMRQAQTEQARRVMELSAEMGVQGGLTIPFHAPGGHWDVVSFSMRDKTLLNSSRIQIMTIKAYGVVQRYRALATRLDEILGGPMRDYPCVHPQHGPSFGEIGDDDCRALVLVDIAWRRYNAGLLELNRRLPDLVGNAPLESFLDRGLIEEEPDDLRFQYVFKPTAVTHSHLKTCPHVASYRDEVWSTYVKVHERPED